MDNLKLKKLVLEFIKTFPKDIKASFIFQDKIYFVIDNKELVEKIENLFKNSAIIFLEDLVENLYEGNQLYMRLIEDSEIIFDNGLIKAFRNLIEKGKIRPSKHAIYHSFLKATKQREKIYELGKSMVSYMFWSLYYLLQAYFMVKEKYITPKEMNELLNLVCEAGEFSRKVYLLYNALYELYFYLHNYKLEEIEYLLKTYEEVFNEIKEKFEVEFKKV